MTLTLCLATLAQPPAESESDRIREEIKAKWGVLVDEKRTINELKITQTVLSTGVISDSDRNAAKMQQAMNRQSKTNESVIALKPRKPVTVTNRIVLRVAGDESEIDVDGSFRDFIQDRVISHREHAIVSNGKNNQFNQLDKQRGVAQVERKESPLIFSKHLESQISMLLLGMTHPSSNQRIFNSLEMRKATKTIIGTGSPSANSNVKYVFSTEFDYAILQSEYTIQNKKFIFEAQYQRQQGIVVPTKWSIKYFERDDLIIKRDYVLDSFLHGDMASAPKSLDYPIDTLVIQRNEESVKYGRIVPDGSIVPIDRKDQTVPLETILEKNRSSNRIRLAAIVLAVIGMAGFVYFTVKSRRRHSAVPLSHLRSDIP